MALRFLVGIKLGEVSDTLMRTSLILARQARAEVHLVHFCEPWSATSWIAAFPEGGTSLELARHAEMRYLEHSQAMMRDFVDELPRDIEVTSRVIFGSPIEGLEEEAKRVNARLILCGAVAQDARFLLSGFSTAVGLMASSARPVLVIPEGSQWHDDSKATLMICDDLERRSERVVEEALAFAAMLPDTRYVHLNVCSVTDRELENMSKYVAEAVSAGLVRHDPAYSAHRTVKERIEETEKRLKDRFFQHPLAAGIPAEKYHAVCVNGAVVDTIRAQQRKWQADVIILGRHEILHQKPFSLGKVPLRSMLALEQPVLLVPPQK